MLPLKRKRQPHYYTEIRDKKVHSEPHLKHCKNEIVPAKKIGPDCKWHVRNRDNIARVRKDEAAAADEEKEIQNRKRKAEQEAKIELLRSQIKNKTCSTLKFENKLVSGIAESQHINLFHTGEFLAKNEEHERELKEEKEKYEKQIGYLTYLGQGTNEADGCVSWYNKSKFEFKNSLKTDFQKDEKLKSALDPLNGIDTILEKKRCYLDNLSKYSKLQEKQLKLTNKEDDMKNKISRKREKDNKIEILREKRLKREKEEKMKIERLLIELKKEKDCGSIQEKEFTPTFLQKYNSQFNPHLARQNHKQ